MSYYSQASDIPVIAEDALLEDMCELGDVEYDNDPTRMSRKVPYGKFKFFRQRINIG